MIKLAGFLKNGLVDSTGVSNYLQFSLLLYSSSKSSGKSKNTFSLTWLLISESENRSLSLALGDRL